MKILRRLLVTVLSISLLALASPLTMSMAETTESDSFPTTNAGKLAILQKYAPRVWLAQDEEFMPSSVDWAFPYMERYQNANDGNRYWIRTKAALSSPSDYTLPVFAGNLASAQTYAFWVTKNNNAVDLVYFFFYPYNRGKEVLFTMWGNHVGDWEHITVRLSKVTTAGSDTVQPSQVYVSAHDFGYTYSWSDMTKVSTTHPVVYSGKGSHGVWKDAGTHVYENLVIASLSDICSQGTAWDTWNTVSGYDYNNAAGLNVSWPAWMSTDYTNAGSGDPSVPGNGPIARWGNEHQGTSYLGQYRLENGPTGPADKDVWNPDTLE